MVNTRALFVAIIGICFGYHLVDAAIGVPVAIATTTTTTVKPDGRHLLLEKAKNDSEEFSESELERLCPSGQLEVLKSVPHGKPCTHGDHEFWHLTCRCHYEKGLQPCPICPDEIPTSTPSSLNLLPHPFSLAWPNFVMSVPQKDYSVLYQMPSSDDKNSTHHKFNIYNSAGGVVSLYFYQLGEAAPKTEATTHRSKVVHG